MANLTSRPKVPSTPQVVYVPQPTVTTTPVTTPSSTATTAEETNATPVSSAEARTQSLLSRPRGILGTVQTSYRGLLSAAGTAQKKTLLGE